MSGADSGRTPWWFGLLLIVTGAVLLVLSGTALKTLGAAYDMPAGLHSILYPCYVVVSVILGWICYPARRTIAWLLWAMMVVVGLMLYFDAIWT